MLHIDAFALIIHCRLSDENPAGQVDKHVPLNRRLGARHDEQLIDEGPKQVAHEILHRLHSILVTLE